MKPLTTFVVGMMLVALLVAFSVQAAASNASETHLGTHHAAVTSDTHTGGNS